MEGEEEGGEHHRPQLKKVLRWIAESRFHYKYQKRKRLS